MRLIRSSDVVLENFRPGVMHRLGLSYEASKASRPDLIYCSVSGYGQSGAFRDHPAIDNIVQASSGIMASNGGPDDPPSRVGWPVVDTYTGTLAALAVLAALMHRTRFGDGQYIDVSMLDASIVMLTSLATPYLLTGQMLPRTGDIGYSGAPTAAMFTAKDGSRISLGAVQNNQFFALCRAIGRLELVSDPRFAQPELRAVPENAEYLRELLNAAFLTRDGAEWERTLSAQHVPCGLVRDIAQACETVRGQRDLLIPTSVPGVSDARAGASYVNAGFMFEHDGPGAEGNAPRLGEHTDEVLRALGYEDPEISQLRSQRVVQ